MIPPLSSSSSISFLLFRNQIRDRIRDRKGTVAVNNCVVMELAGSETLRVWFLTRGVTCVGRSPIGSLCAGWLHELEEVSDMISADDYDYSPVIWEPKSR